MSNNLLSERDRELEKYAQQYETAISEGKSFYLEGDDWADLANWYSTKKYYSKAFEIAEYGLKQHPGNQDLLIEYAYLYLDSGKKEKAQEIVNSLKDDFLTDAKIVRACVLMSFGKLDEAERVIDTIENKYDLANLIDISYMYIDAGCPDKAFELFDVVKDKYADNELYIALVADYYFSKEMIDDSACLYNKLIDINPYSPSYWFGLARCYFDQMNMEQTIDACDYALVSDENYAEAHAMKGHCFFQLGNIEMAQECFAKAQELHGVEPGFLQSFIGLCKTSSGEWEEAYENLEKAIQINEAEEVPSTLLPSLYANAGLCLSMLGESKKAHSYCKKAQLLKPNEAEAYLIEGRIYSEEGDFANCIAMWEKALEYDPSAETWNEIGMHFLEVGDIPSARDAFNNVYDYNPSFEGINEKLAILHLVMHDKDNFIKYNSKCDPPISIEKLKQMKEMMENENQDELAAYIRKMINKKQ